MTWASLLGLVLPLCVALAYVPRVLREATLDDLVILAAAMVFTYASKRNVGDGAAHEPYYLYVVVLWSMNACCSEGMRHLRSIPLIGVMTFVSILVPDIMTSIYHRPEGRVGIPGGAGLADGLVLKPLMAVGVTWLAYYLKVNPILPNKRRRSKYYDEESKQYLLNARPGYRRPTIGFEGVLKPIQSASA